MKILLILFLSVSILPAKELSQKSRYSHLINIAGQQRMLSQRIAKAYFFYNMRVRMDRMQQQMIESIQKFEQNYQILSKEAPSKDIQEMLDFIAITKKDFFALLKVPFSLERAAEVIDYSETLLEASQDVVNRLLKEAGFKSNETIDLAGRQRMLAQRIAKFYIAYQAGLKNSYMVGEIKKAIEQFEKAQSQLIRFPKNNPEIRIELNKTNNLWRTVSRFYKNVEKRPLPVIILTTTDRITRNMNKITHLYEQTIGGG